MKKSTQGVSYREIPPHQELHAYIYCYWELHTEQQLAAPFTYRVVTDGCIDIFFDLTNPTNNFVMGFCKKYTEFPLANSFHYVGVRFLPTIFSQIFRIDASILSNQSLPLQDVVSPLSDFIASHFSAAMSTHQLASTLDEYFLSLIHKNSMDDDHRLYDAINLILKNFGVVNLEEDLHTGISHRQLRRLFNYYIGATPKTFSKVVRFQNILRAKPSTQSLRKSKLFYDLGYYDQAHFVKDFKTFYGVTPSKAFGRS